MILNLVSKQVELIGLMNVGKTFEIVSSNYIKELPKLKSYYRRINQRFTNYLKSDSESFELTWRISSTEHVRGHNWRMHI